MTRNTLQTKQYPIGMVAFGTVMGGAGASLKGGNFWQGAATGLVVSGLNHLAHRLAAISDLKSRFKKDANGKYIVDPNGKPDFSQAGVERINGAVEGLQDAYTAGGKPKITFDEVNDVAYTEPDHVKLNPSKISNNLQYATTLFHEYRHAWQYLPGQNGLSKYNIWTIKHGTNSANWLLERDAYWYQIQMGAGQYYDGYSRYEFYRNLTSKIKLPY